MIKAFISHSSAQKTFADEIARILGFDNCFIDNSTFENGMKTIDEMRKALDVTDRTIARYLSDLKEHGIIKRIGPDNGG